MEKSVNLLEYLPDRWRSLEEIKAICNSDMESVDDVDTHTLPHLWDCMDAELNNAFIIPYGEYDGADEYACSRWESILGIVAPDDMSLEDRQFNIFTKLFQSAPYTYKKLEEMLDELIGASNYAMSRDTEAKVLNVKLSITSRYRISAVIELLDRLVPANMILNTTIVYTTHDHMAIHTHDELSAYTHDEIKVTQMYDEI